MLSHVLTPKKYEKGTQLSGKNHVYKQNCY